MEFKAPEPKRRLTDDEYEFIFQRVPRLCVDIVIIEDEKVLLSKREKNPFKGYWALQGGMVRYKETIDEALERILYNELGVKYQAKKLIGYIDNHDDGSWLQSISLVFLVKKEGEPRGSDQGYEIGFFTHIPEDTQPYHKEFLKNNLSIVIANQ